MPINSCLLSMSLSTLNDRVIDGDDGSEGSDGDNGIDGDDGVDFSLDGNVVTSFYCPHGFAGYHYGTVSLVAGKSYAFMARYQNWSGGWGMYLVWKRPSQSTWSIQSTEVTGNPSK